MNSRDGGGNGYRRSNDTYQPYRQQSTSSHGSQYRSTHNQNQHNQQPTSGTNTPTTQQQQQQPYDRGYQNFDGKRVRRAIQRRTIDYNASVMRYWEFRNVQRCRQDHIAMQPEPQFTVNLLPPFVYSPYNTSTSFTTKFVHTSTNKNRCPINTVRFTPEGRRLVTGSSNGEFTLWNGLTFNFETILQAHDAAIRCMKWSHDDVWMLTADDTGTIKYWHSNMNNLNILKSHTEIIRDLSFSPTDSKFASASDDGTVKIWRLMDGIEERVLTGHGWDVKCVDWHPTKSLIATGSKDNLVKLWDPKHGTPLTTLHGHKNTVLGVQWNRNGNWLLTACRDQLIRVFDIRTMKLLQVFRGHDREVQSIAWHPIHETMFASGGWEGSLLFWNVGTKEAETVIENAHESSVFAMDWHPMGHVLVTGSNDHATRFWTRNRPGDSMYDKFNWKGKGGDGGVWGALNTNTSDGQVHASEFVEARQLPGLGRSNVKNLDLSDVPQTGYSSHRVSQNVSHGASQNVSHAGSADVGAMRDRVNRDDMHRNGHPSHNYQQQQPPHQQQHPYQQPPQQRYPYQQQMQQLPQYPSHNLLGQMASQGIQISPSLAQAFQQQPQQYQHGQYPPQQYQQQGQYQQQYHR